jgi:hypothetical protein
MQRLARVGEGCLFWMVSIHPDVALNFEESL